MTHPHWNDAHYAAGFEHLRTAMIEGLALRPGEQHAGSYLIGAYCAMVQVIWETRDPRRSATDVAATLASVMSDVLQDASGGPVPTSDPDGALAQAIRAAVTACAPRDSQGEPILDEERILAACAMIAAQLLAGVPTAFGRSMRAGEFLVDVENRIEAEMALRSARQ